MRKSFAHKQKGVVLIAAMVFLVVITLIVVSAASSSKFSFRIAANAQFRAEAIAAAQRVIDSKLADQSFFSTTTPSSTVNVDIDGDGNNDYTVILSAPGCISMGPDPSYSYIASQPQIGIWQVTATATNSATGATATVVQGVRMTSPVGTTCTN